MTEIIIEKSKIPLHLLKFFEPIKIDKGAIWTIPVQPFHANHFSTYPRTLVEILIRAGCPRGGVVLDPFIGSGTTGVVAKSLSRNFLGIELSRAYITLAQSILNQK